MIVPWKALVVNQVGQDGKRRAPRLGELDRAFAQTFFEQVEVEIEKRARIAHDDKRFRLDPAPRFGPEIAGVVQGRGVA